MKPLIELPNCPGCEVAVGTAHSMDCCVAQCLHLGTQRLVCQESATGGQEHQCGQDVWAGLWPGQLDAARLGFWCNAIYPGGAVIDANAEDPGAVPNTTRLISEARWDPETRRWEARADIAARPPVLWGPSPKLPRAIDDRVLAVLMAAAAPMSVADIHTAVNADGGRQISLGSIRIALLGHIENGDAQTTPGGLYEATGPLTWKDLT